jgi:3-methyl-2-oxobutanoate hydroxymethyltransferase
MLGMYDRMTPKFVKKYAHLSLDIKNAVQDYISEVKQGKFPDNEHSFK